MQNAPRNLRLLFLSSQMSIMSVMEGTPSAPVAATSALILSLVAANMSTTSSRTAL